MLMHVMQETPDTPEALACVPALQLEDIPKQAGTIPNHVSQLNGATLLQHDLFTNDVLYLEAALDLHPVPAHLLPLVPLFSRCTCCTDIVPTSLPAGSSGLCAACHPRTLHFSHSDVPLVDCIAHALLQEALTMAMNASIAFW